MLEYIHNHYKENMELEDLSKVTYSTESHLARLFKKHMGITILSYIHQLRIEEACRLLSGHECDIQELRSGWDMQASIISINTSNAMWV